MHRRLTSLALLTVLALLASAATAAAGIGTGSYGSVTPLAGARTIPYFTDSFGFGGVAYPYRMVGTNPRTSGATTTVRTVIVPLRLVFADGHVSEPGTIASSVIGSPLFQNARFASGTTQYGDAMQRASFWAYDARTSNHTLLAQPLVLPTQTLNVPQGQGAFLQPGDEIVPGFHAAVPAGVVSASWFAGAGPDSSGAFGALLSRLNVDPAMLPIVVSRNVILDNGVVGFHSTSSSGSGNGSQQVQTAIWADYAEPDTVTEFPDTFRNVDILSHEVAEWLADPFDDNQVPAWRSPRPLADGFYGCSPLLETGDPLVDVAFQANGYQLSDEAFFSWFAHQVPSIGINGRYTYLGTFKGPSPLC